MGQQQHRNRLVTSAFRAHESPGKTARPPSAPPVPAKTRAGGGTVSGGGSDLWEDLGGEKFDVIEVADVEDLQVDAIAAHLGEPSDLVDDFCRSAGDAGLA